MQETPPSFVKTEPALTPVQFETYADDWLLDCKIRKHSPRTLTSRRELLAKFLWFCREHKRACINRAAIRAFLDYVGGDVPPGGRWGNPQANRPVSSETVKTYHRILRSFFRWIIAEGGLAESPMLNINIPVSRPDQVQPCSQEEIAALLAAAEKTAYPERNAAILLFLLDTGARVSEVVELTLSNLDMDTRTALLRGKGDKIRVAHFSPPTRKALLRYLGRDYDTSRDAADPVFLAQRGTDKGKGLTRSGIEQTFADLALLANLPRKKCSPHKMRHTFAIEYLRGDTAEGGPGGNQMTLKVMLGHTSLSMTERYVAIAEADVANQHRQFSPVEKLLNKRKKK